MSNNSNYNSYVFSSYSKLPYENKHYARELLAYSEKINFINNTINNEFLNINTNTDGLQVYPQAKKMNGGNKSKKYKLIK